MAAMKLLQRAFEGIEAAVTGELGDARRMLHDACKELADTQEELRQTKEQLKLAKSRSDHYSESAGELAREVLAYRFNQSAPNADVRRQLETEVSRLKQEVAVWQTFHNSKHEDWQAACQHRDKLETTVKDLQKNLKNLNRVEEENLLLRRDCEAMAGLNFALDGENSVLKAQVPHLEQERDKLQERVDAWDKELAGVREDVRFAQGEVKRLEQERNDALVVAQERFETIVDHANRIEELEAKVREAELDAQETYPMPKVGDIVRWKGKSYARYLVDAVLQGGSLKDEYHIRGPLNPEPDQEVGGRWVDRSDPFWTLEKSEDKPCGTGCPLNDSIPQQVAQGLPEADEAPLVKPEEVVPGSTWLYRTFASTPWEKAERVKVTCIKGGWLVLDGPCIIHTTVSRFVCHALPIRDGQPTRNQLDAVVENMASYYSGEKLRGRVGVAVWVSLTGEPWNPKLGYQTYRYHCRPGIEGVSFMVDTALHPHGIVVEPDYEVAKGTVVLHDEAGRPIKPPQASSTTP